MGRGKVVTVLVAALTLEAASLQAQWRDPKLIAGQLGFGVAVSFVGKLIGGYRSWKQALRESLIEGSTAGVVAHIGYATAGRNPELALVGKALVQKSGLMIDRSIHGQPVFDRSFFTEWALTHGFVHFRLQERPAVEIDVLNAALAAYFLSRDGYAFDGRRTLYSGSLVFRNLEPPPGTRGWAAPGVIWLGAANYDNREVFGHEIVHSLQFERGAAIYDLHRGFFRLNVLSFSTAVPALLNGWPEHDRRWHEREADLYAGRR
jgi:hypothetical protein